MAKLHLGISNEIVLWLGLYTEAQGTTLKGCGVRKLETHRYRGRALGSVPQMKSERGREAWP